MEETMYVVSTLRNSLIRGPAIKILSLVKRLAAVSDVNTLTKQFPMIFNGFGKIEESTSERGKQAILSINTMWSVHSPPLPRQTRTDKDGTTEAHLSTQPAN